MPKKKTIVSIGAGNIAHHIIPALHNTGCLIKQVFSRSIVNAEALASIVQASTTDDLSQINTEADLYLIMVNDDAIATVSKQLFALTNNQYIAHTSGSIDSEVLREVGGNYGCFYPLQSFKKNHPTDISEVPILITGHNENTKVKLHSLAKSISNNVSSITDKDRLRYHLAAVMINNFTNHLACKTSLYLQKYNLDSSVLDALTKKTFEKILTANACDIQTGPAIRNDKKVEKNHLKLLKDEKELSRIYKSISRSIKKQYHEDS